MEHFEKLIKPCSVFMTFEKEEGVKRALKLDKNINWLPLNPEHQS